MTTLAKQVTDYLADIGRKGGKIGGKSKSRKKVLAAQDNGRKGGRPKKQSKHPKRKK